MKSKDSSLFHDPKIQTKNEVEYRDSLGDYFNNSIGTTVERLENFGKYVPRQRLTRFLVLNEIFKKILHVHGSIVECGVLFGGGLMSWAQLSSIYEPLNFQRKIIGFDTFSGFAELSEKDKTGESELLFEGGLAVDSYEDLQKAIGLYDKNRFLGHIPKMKLVKGDIVKTVPEYIKQNPSTVVSLLYLDVDVFEPTKVAIEQFVPRMPKGSIIVFDELNSEYWPGETLAVLETLGIRDIRLERFDFDTMTSFAVLD